MSTPDASYELVSHSAAASELEKVPDETRERLVETFNEMATTKQPASLPDIESLSNHAGLLRVRVGRHRAVLALDPPQLKLLQVGHRDGFYQRLDVAQRRRDE